MNNSLSDSIKRKITDDLNADILLCNSNMDRPVDAELIDLCRSRNRRENIALVLVTSGGDPDVAFKIARFLQCAYKRFICIIPGWCKSAGTLLSLGAHEVVFGAHGELGPLDVQMAKKDELLGLESGLTVMTALTAIHEKTLLAFEHFFIETTFKGGGRLTVQTASEIAVGLAKGIFGPISSQIDPIHIGEAWRSMAIANDYGQRLLDKSRNVRSGALDKVITGYPSHGFVIDRLEAESIFLNVREAGTDEQNFLDALGPLGRYPERKTLIRFLNDELQEQVDAGNSENIQERRNVEPSAEAGDNPSSAGPAAEAIQRGSGKPSVRAKRERRSPNSQGVQVN